MDITLYLHPDDYFYSPYFNKLTSCDPVITIDENLLRKTALYIDRMLNKDKELIFYPPQQLHGIHELCEASDIETIKLAKSLIFQTYIPLSGSIYHLLLNCMRYNLLTNDDYLWLYNCSVRGSFLETIRTLSIINKLTAKSIINFLNERFK